jgi:hypothetical protein
MTMMREVEDLQRWMRRCMDGGIVANHAAEVILFGG